MPLATLDLSLARWLLLVAWGGFVGLDGVSWLQVMVSRPIVAGTVGGIVFGDPQAGFLAGAVLEIISFRHPPFGGARYPESGPAGLVAGAAYAATDGGGYFPLLMVVLAGWVIGWVGSHTIHWLRLINVRLVGDPESLSRNVANLKRAQHLAMRLDALRAALITAAFLVPVAMAVRFAEGLDHGALGERLSVGLAAVGIACVAGSGARGLSVGRRSWPLLLGGAVLGLGIAAVIGSV